MSRKTASPVTLLLGAVIAAGVFLLPSAGSEIVSPKNESRAAAHGAAESETDASTAARVAQRADRKRIEKIVREYLIRNPEVLVEAMRALEAKRKTRRARTARSMMQKHKKQIYADAEAPVGGNPDGDVTIVEFFDYRCGFCKRAARTVEDALAKDKQIRIVYKEFPILGPNSLLAARAALASRAQGKYLAFHKALMEAKISYDERSVMQIAASVGIDTARLKKDMRAPRIQEHIDRNRALARALHIRGTPAFIVGEQLFPGAPTQQQLARMIQNARRRP